MKLLLIVVAVLVVLVAVVGLFGVRLPATRTAALRVEINAPPERVWRVLTDVAAQPRWRPDLATVEVIDATPGRERWIERPRRGPEIHFTTRSRVELREWQLEFRGPAEGTWRGRLEPLPGGKTRLEVEEAATIRNPWQRALARMVFDPQQFLADYAARLATTAEKPE
jgi:hypothetical protein